MEEKEKKKHRQEEKEEVLVRILGYDVLGSRTIYAGLTRIKGVSWTLSNAVCKILNLDKKKRISELTKEEVSKIEAALQKLEVADYMKNRRKDLGDGETTHLLGPNLDIKKEFDIKRLKKIKSYRGQRHSLKLPSRGQRTRSNFRRGGGAVGVKKPKTGKKG